MQQERVLPDANRVEYVAATPTNASPRDTQWPAFPLDLSTGSCVLLPLEYDPVLVVTVGLKMCCNSEYLCPFEMLQSNFGGSLLRRLDSSLAEERQRSEQITIF